MDVVNLIHSYDLPSFADDFSFSSIKDTLEKVWMLSATLTDTSAKCKYLFQDFICFAKERMFYPKNVENYVGEEIQFEGKTVSFVINRVPAIDPKSKIVVFNQDIKIRRVVHPHEKLEPSLLIF
jgi:hypothetical protein